MLKKYKNLELWKVDCLRCQRSRNSQISIAREWLILNGRIQGLGFTTPTWQTQSQPEIPRARTISTDSVNSVRVDGNNRRMQKTFMRHPSVISQLQAARYVLFCFFQIKTTILIPSVFGFKVMFFIHPISAHYMKYPPYSLHSHPHSWSTPPHLCWAMYHPPHFAGLNSFL